MMLDTRIGLCTALALALSPAAAQRVPPADTTAYVRAIAAGYKAAVTCAGVFDAGRTPTQIDADELRGIYPEYDAIVPTLTAAVDRMYGSVSVAFDPRLPPRRAVWRKGAGCTTLPIGARTVPTTRIEQPTVAPADPRPWPMGDAGIAPRPGPALAAAVARAFDHASYGKGETVCVVVLHAGRIVAERYRGGFGPFTANRTWSAGKSIAGTLVGLASTVVPIDPMEPAAIPEWRGEAPGDVRPQITLDNLLRMASGLHSGAAGNRTDAIYFGGTAVTEEATGWPVEAMPGTRFRYANDDILLAMRTLRASLGDARYRGFPTRALFAPLGMTHTVAERDWRGDYVISSQNWSTARDLARIGQFWLQDGVWQGKQMLPAGWMRYLTTPSGPQPADGPGYGATMWLFGPQQGLPAGSYAAQGNRGQYVMVIPSARLVIVRRGEDPGAARFDIARFAADVLAATP